METTNAEPENTLDEVARERRVKEPARDDKTADRPHRLTLVAAFGALTLSIVGLIVSGLSVYYTHLGLKVGQRAYLSFTPTFPTYDDDPSASENDVISLPASIEIKNLGNTPAYDVNVEILPWKADSQYRFWLSQPPFPAIGPKDTVRVSFNIAGSRKVYKNGQSLPGAAPALCATVNYADVFGSRQTDRSCFSPAFKMTVEMYNPPHDKPSP